MSDEKLVTVRAFMPPEVRSSFKSICVKQGVTMNDVIVAFVEDYIRKYEANGAKANIDSPVTHG